MLTIGIILVKDGGGCIMKLLNRLILGAGALRVIITRFLVSCRGRRCIALDLSENLNDRLYLDV